MLDIVFRCVYVPPVPFTLLEAGPEPKLGIGPCHLCVMFRFSMWKLRATSVNRVSDVPVVTFEKLTDFFLLSPAAPKLVLSRRLPPPPKRNMRAKCGIDDYLLPPLVFNTSSLE